MHPWLVAPVWRARKVAGPQTRVVILLRGLRRPRGINGEAVRFWFVGRVSIIASRGRGRGFIVTNGPRFTMTRSAVVAHWRGLVVAWLRGAVVPPGSVLVGGPGVVAHGLLVALLVPCGLRGRGLLVVWGPLFVVMRHTVVVVQVRVSVVRLWFCVAASIVSVRRVVVFTVWLFVLVRRLVTVAQRLLQAVVDSHRVLHIVQIFLVHL